MGIAEGILLLALALGGGYTWGYFDKPDKMCKNINFQAPPEFKEEHNVKDCLETEDISCDQVVPYPRYVVPQSEYYNLNIHVKETKLYLDTCENAIFRYNNDKYVKQ